MSKNKKSKHGKEKKQVSNGITKKTKHKVHKSQGFQKAVGEATNRNNEPCSSPKSNDYKKLLLENENMKKEIIELKEKADADNTITMINNLNAEYDKLNDENKKINEKYEKVNCENTKLKETSLSDTLYKEVFSEIEKYIDINVLLTALGSDLVVECEDDEV